MLRHSGAPSLQDVVVIAGSNACAPCGYAGAGRVDADAKKIVGAVKITRRHFDQATECVRCDRLNS